MNKIMKFPYELSWWGRVKLTLMLLTSATLVLYLYN
jgi:hypothetical protein